MNNTKNCSRRPAMPWPRFSIPRPAIKNHFDERGIECDDFAKKLLGQIVFLYFLQKKGWFGVERGKPWGSGRKDFIRHLFNNRADYAHIPGQRKRLANFFNDILEPLFYEAIAAPRTDEDHYYSRFDCRIPFLNGGLFEPLYGYNWVETEILLPDTLFANDEQTKERNRHGHPRRIRPLQFHRQRSRAAGKGSCR